MMKRLIVKANSKNKNQNMKIKLKKFIKNTMKI